MSHRNAVLALRQQELAKATRTFSARGSKVVRCKYCLLPAVSCICAARPQPSARSAFCFIMYTGECYKPSNTGRLIADIASDSYAFVWDRTRHQPELLTILSNPAYAPVVVFPQQYAEPERCLHNSEQLQQWCSDRIPLFIMLDGTWREAKKMFRSSYLENLPVLGIQPEQASDYRLREAAHLHQLCTAEVAVEVLKLAEDHKAANDLTQYFTVFRRHYMEGKPHLQFTE